MLESRKRLIFLVGEFGSCTLTGSCWVFDGTELEFAAEPGEEGEGEGGDDDDDDEFEQLSVSEF